MAEQKQPAERKRKPKDWWKPWMPSEYDLADATAIQGLHNGTATPEQQKRALTWLIAKSCRTYDQTFIPGPEGARESDFAQGRRSVGLELVKMLSIDLSNWRRTQNG